MDVQCGLASSLSNLIGCLQDVVSLVSGLHIEYDQCDDAIVIGDLVALRWPDLHSIHKPCEAWWRVSSNLDYQPEMDSRNYTLR